MQGIMANFIWDIAKIYKLKLDKSIVEVQLNTFLKDFEDTDIDSGVFDNFLKLSTTRIHISNYIDYGIYGELIQEDSITKEQFLDNISANAYEYIKVERNSDLLEIKIDIIRKYFDVLMKTIERSMIKELSKNKNYNEYLIRIKIEGIIDRINGINKFNYEKIVLSIEDTKEKYIKQIKNKYAKSHIYGINELKFSQFYIKPDFTISSQDDGLTSINENVDDNGIKIQIIWENIFEYSNIISVIGGAGFGKTVYLKNLMNEYKNLNLINASDMIPIYCDLKKFANNSKKNMGYTISQFLVDSMKYDTSIDNIDNDFLKYYLNKGQLLILFDALDEVVYEERENIHNIIVNFFDDVNKNNRICITSRERGFIPKTNISYKVNELNEAHVLQYIDKMIKINEFKAEYKLKFVKECGKLIKTNFLNSFLLLSLMVNIHNAERKMPKNKTELYKKAVEYITRDREKGTGDGYTRKSEIDFNKIGSILDKDESFEIIASLGNPNNSNVSEEKIIGEFLQAFQYTYACENDVRNAIKEFLKFCSERTELVVKSAEKEYKFYHKSFFEYFYSKYLINNFDLQEILSAVISNDLDDEIVSITLDILKYDNYKKYRELIVIFIKKLEDGEIKPIDSINLAIYLDEIGFIFKICEIFLTKNFKISSGDYINKSEYVLVSRKINFYMYKIYKLDNLKLNNLLESYIISNCYNEYIEVIFNEFIKRETNKEYYLTRGNHELGMEWVSSIGLYNDQFIGNKNLTMINIMNIFKGRSLIKRTNKFKNEKFKNLLILKFYNKYFNMSNKESAVGK